MSLALGLRIFLVIGCALGVFGSTYWVGSQLRQVGALKEEVAVKDARMEQLITGQKDLRTEIKGLSASVSKRDTNNAGVVAAIEKLRTVEEPKNACDDQPLSAGYIERVRAAADVASAGTARVSDSAGKLPRTDSSSAP